MISIETGIVIGIYSFTGGFMVGLLLMFDFLRRRGELQLLTGREIE